MGTSAQQVIDLYMGKSKMEQKPSLPEYLKQLRKACGYNQKDIAVQLHITRQTYSHYETGRITPSINTLYHIAQIYEISVNDILEHVRIDDLTKEENPVVEIRENRLFDPEFMSCIQSLDERDREEVISIMWEIMQIKKKSERQ